MVEFSDEHHEDRERVCCGLDRDVHAFHASHVEVRDSVLLGKLRILTYRQKSSLIHQPESQR